MSRAYRNYAGEINLDSFRDYDRSPASRTAHKGLCRCGAETSRSVTVGPAGDPRNGWQCRECGEQFIRAQFDKSARKAASGSPEGQK